jgi:hypothetical protein
MEGPDLRARAIPRAGRVVQVGQNVLDDNSYQRPEVGPKFDYVLGINLCPADEQGSVVRIGEGGGGILRRRPAPRPARGRQRRPGFVHVV